MALAAAVLAAAAVSDDRPLAVAAVVDLLAAQSAVAAMLALPAEVVAAAASNSIVSFESRDQPLVTAFLHIALKIKLKITPKGVVHAEARLPGAGADSVGSLELQ